MNTAPVVPVAVLVFKASLALLAKAAKAYSNNSTVTGLAVFRNVVALPGNPKDLLFRFWVGLRRESSVRVNLKPALFGGKDSVETGCSPSTAERLFRILPVRRSVGAYGFSWPAGESQVSTTQPSFKRGLSIING